jgi:hypothetical protein
MSEKPRGIEYQHVPYDRIDFEYEPSGELADMFKNADSVKAEVIKNYVRDIVEQVNSSKDPKVQKACIIDLLREDSIKKLIKEKLSNEPGKKEDDPKVLIETEDEQKNREEIEKMTSYWVNRIKKQIIEELKIHLPDDLYYFVTEKSNEQILHFNKKSFVIDARTDKKYFFKESDFTFVQIRKQIEECFNILKQAQENLAKQGKDMPFIVKPENIGQNTKYNYPDKHSLSYLSEKKDITPVENIIVESDDGTDIEYKQLDEANALKTLTGILDCLKGTQFLSKNGLTITDLNTTPIGKNFGINSKNNQGILFDLDGLHKVGSELIFILGPVNSDGTFDTTFYAPEYRQFITDSAAKIDATSESMIWEIGQSILRLSNIQADKLFKSTNFFANQKLVSFWEKLKDFSKKMTADKPADRPSFEACIIKIEEIINKFSEQK